MIKFEDVKNVSTEEYFKNNQYAIDIFKTKYTFKKENGERENPAEVFYRIASNAAQFEKDSEYYTNVGFDLMGNDGFRPGGSIIGGIGSNRKISLMNCTTIPIEGDSLEDISKAEYSLMKTASYRQGMGIDLSNLRPRGARLGNAAEYSTGIIPGGEKFSNVGEYVGQLGRRPAVLESLKIIHPDSEEFILSKKERGKLENSNISVQITDDFMDALENNKAGQLYFKTNREEIKKEVDPNYLIDLIADTAAQSAEPGVQFIDQMKKGTILEAIYKSTKNPKYEIISTNACCFPEETNINTEKGKLTLQEIRDKFNNNEEIKILSYNLEENKYEYQELENVHIRENGNPQHLIELEIENDDGSLQTIECTPDHKIYTKTRGGIEASKLTEDDELLEIK